MEFPLFRNPWNASSCPFSYDQSLRGIPVEPVKPKVVSIPVHFVGSELRRFESVIKIQKVFRGFLVRKNMNKIKAIRDEVNRVELSISKKETVDSIRNDSKESLKVNEVLMGLLLKLDSVRGVDSGVRDCRKSVIKKAIALQELVDAIVSVDQSNDADDHDLNEDTIASAADHCNQTSESRDHDDAIKNAESVSVFTESNDADNDVNEETIASAADLCNQTLSSQDHDDAIKNVEFVSDFTEAEPNKEAANEEKMENGFVQSQCATASDNDDTATTKDVEAQQETTELKNESAANEEKMESRCENDFSNHKEVEEETKGQEDDDAEKKRNMEMEFVEKMMEDNEKMMGLMTLLFQKNELPTRMLSALTQRVERLEKSILCDKSRRKKRRSVADKK